MSCARMLRHVDWRCWESNHDLPIGEDASNSWATAAQWYVSRLSVCLDGHRVCVKTMWVELAVTVCPGQTASVRNRISKIAWLSMAQQYFTLIWGQSTCTPSFPLHSSVSLLSSSTVLASLHLQAVPCCSTASISVMFYPRSPVRALGLQCNSMRHAVGTIL